MLVTRFATVRPFLTLLVEVVDFGATPEGAPVLAALRGAAGPARAARRSARRRSTPSCWPGRGGAWCWPRRTGGRVGGLEGVRVLRAGAVPPHAAPPGDLRDELLQVGRPAGEAAGRRGVGAGQADRAGHAWACPSSRGDHLAARAALLDGTYREVAGRLPANAADQRSTRTAGCTSPPWSRQPEPASLVDLRTAVNGDAAPGRPARGAAGGVLLDRRGPAFTSVTGGEARLKDLHVTIAALLVAHGCNVGYTPVIRPGVDALTRTAGSPTSTRPTCGWRPTGPPTPR